jgi:uncharacterized membrane protein YidH (DUF202 family)
MSTINLWQLLFNSLVALAVAVGIVKVSVAVLKDEHRKIVGGVLLLIGIMAAIFGVISVNSVKSLLSGAIGQPDLGGRAAIALGVLAAITGIVIVVSRKSSRGFSQTASTKKCPDCAETIQAEAKVCRFCGKILETPAAN